MAEPKKYTDRLANQRVLIFGGTSGLGYGLAEALVEHGCEVIISSSSEQKVKDRVDKLQSTYPSSKGRVRGYACNLSGSDAPQQVATVFSEVGTLDHVVHTAGDPLRPKKIGDWNLQEMQQAGMVRFFGPMLIAQHLSKHLKGGPASSFTITSGYVGEKPSPNWSIINAYATGAFGLTRGLALDLAPIRVNCIAPGAVETEFWNSMKESGHYEQTAGILVEKSTTKQFGKVEDVVEGYLYLLKDKNVTGMTISSNSGSHLV
ncbi:MAG: hypothetical protein LQ340_003206 [Diploschistes diacapsis]|nr:MAG: hypothetical protein LQ340_003206 [Diploschistes diacapsis]